VVLLLAATLPHGRALTFNVDPAKVLLRFSLRAARLPLKLEGLLRCVWRVSLRREARECRCSMYLSAKCRDNRLQSVSGVMVRGRSAVGWRQSNSKY